MNRFFLVFIILNLCIHESLATISQHFDAFLKSKYGGATANLIKRQDLGGNGSFGGGKDGKVRYGYLSSKPMSKQAIISGENQ